MKNRSSMDASGWLYVARRVWWRLLAALYVQRVKIVGAILALLALGLVSLMAGGVQSQGALDGVGPAAASVAQLEPDSDKASGEPPQMYELLGEIISHLGGRVDYVVITRTDLGATVGRIVITTETGDTVVVHAQPSEAVALALAGGARIFVDGELFDA
jgi:hypothetical protein